MCAALVMKNGMREKRKAKKERKKRLAKKDVSKGESENERLRQVVLSLRLPSQKKRRRKFSCCA